MKAHSSLRTPTKEKGYRFVRLGEVLREDDEFFDAFEGTWNPITKISIGFELDGESVGMFRRMTK